MPSRKNSGSPKAILKTFGWILLAIYVVADFGFVFGLIDANLYKALAPIGMQSFLLLNAVFMSIVIVFLFSFITSLSLFSSASNEAIFLSMPLKSTHLLASRMVTVYAIEAPVAFLIMAVAAGVYGFSSHSSVGFYLTMGINALVLPLVPLALSYAVLVPLMSTSRWLRQKNTILYLGGFVGLALALAFNFYLQETLSQVQDPATIQHMMSQGSISFADMANWWPPAWLALRAIENTLTTGSATQTQMVAVAATLGNAALSLALCALVARAFGKSYGKILTTFGESSSIKSTIRSQQGSKQGQNIFRARNVFFSLLAREFHLMNREPMFFLNGPFVILLIPLILILTFIARRNELLNLALNLRTYFSADSAAYLIPAGFGVFLASSTSITGTSFSRDAKSLYFLKSMPLAPRHIIMAKLAHGLVFAVLGIAIGTLSSALFLKIASVDTLIALILAMLGSLCLNLAGLAIDMFFPRLSWENPISALKQNPNSVIMILGTMGLIAGLGVLSRALPAEKYFCAILYGILFSVVSVILWFVLSNFGVKRFRRMEP